MMFARALTTEDTALDVNEDGSVTAADALVMINQMIMNDLSRLTNYEDGPSSAVDEPFQTSDDGVKELALADVSPYGVVHLQINDDGLLVATADDEIKDVAVGTDGSLSIDEVILPAHLVTSTAGEALLMPGYVPSSDFLSGDDVIVGDEGIAHIDEQALNESRLAGYMILTLVTNQRNIVLTVNEDHSVSAISDGESLNVTIGDDNSLIVDGVVLPVILRRFEDSALLVPTDIISVDNDFTWAGLVDEAMALFV
jgi:Dockerin type I domain